MKTNTPRVMCSGRVDVATVREQRVRQHIRKKGTTHTLCRQTQSTGYRQGMACFVLMLFAATVFLRKFSVHCMRGESANNDYQEHGTCLPSCEE